MTLWRITIREMRRRKLNLCSAVLAVAVAVGSLVGAASLLRAYDVHTEQVLAEKRDQAERTMKELKQRMRKATLKLSFNVVILPEGQSLRDWHTDDYAAKYMPEQYVEKLADSGVVTVRHFLPALQQKIKWPERNLTIILVGTRGEVPNLHKSQVKPLVQPVPPGTIVLGHELHQRLGVNLGEKVTLMGREFTVHRRHAQRGSKDDITAWIHLREAQELLDKKGLVNAILALECLCAGVGGLPKVKDEIRRVLPGTQVIEQGTKALARAEARLKVGKEAKAAVAREKRDRQALRAERERFAALLTPVVMVGCAVWIALSVFVNVRERRPEIGVLRALGFRANQVLFLFLAKALLTGLVGGVAGVLGGYVAGARLGAALEGAEAAAGAWPPFDPAGSLAALLAAVMLALIASWIPALLAARQDPADILRDQ